MIDLGAEVAYVDYKPGHTEGWIRLQGTNAAQSILDKMTDKKVRLLIHLFILKINIFLNLSFFISNVSD